MFVSTIVVAKISGPCSLAFSMGPSPDPRASSHESLVYSVPHTRYQCISWMDCLLDCNLLFAFIVPIVLTIMILMTLWPFLNMIRSRLNVMQYKVYTSMVIPACVCGVGLATDCNRGRLCKAYCPDTQSSSFLSVGLFQGFGGFSFCWSQGFLTHTHTHTHTHIHKSCMFPYPVTTEIVLHTSCVSILVFQRWSFLFSILCSVSEECVILCMVMFNFHLCLGNASYSEHCVQLYSGVCLYTYTQTHQLCL